MGSSEFAVQSRLTRTFEPSGPASLLGSVFCFDSPVDSLCVLCDDGLEFIRSDGSDRSLPLFRSRQTGCHRLPAPQSLHTCTFTANTRCWMAATASMN